MGKAILPALLIIPFFSSCIIGGGFEGTYYIILDFDSALYDCAEGYEGADMSGESALIDFYPSEGDGIVIALSDYEFLMGTVSGDTFEASYEEISKIDYGDGNSAQSLSTITMEGVFGEDGYISGTLIYSESDEEYWEGELDVYKCQVSYTFEGYRLDIVSDDYVSTTSY